MGALQDEMREAYNARIKDGATKPGAEGAFYRLMGRANPSEITDWLNAEDKLGTDVEDLLIAAQQYLASVMISFATSISVADDIRLSLNVLNLGAADYIMRAFSGKNPIEIVTLDPKTGAESLATFEGIAKGGR